MAFIERFTDSQGDLFIKFPLINALLNERKWRASPEANSLYAHTAIGKPLTVMLDKAMSLFHDYHPFSLKVGATDEEHIAFARKYAIGDIVDVTQNSGKYKAAAGEYPWFGIAKITDPTAKEELKKPDTKMIPPAFSPGIIQLDGPDDNITRYKILHVAAVPAGAFGPKFVTVAKCQGAANQCGPQLRAAAAAILQQQLPTYKERTGCCPLDAFSSLHLKSANNEPVMSLNPNASTPAPGTFPSPESQQSLATQRQQQQQTTTRPKPIIRVTRRLPSREPSPNPNPNNPEENGEPGNGQEPQPGQGQRRAFNDPEFVQMKRELRENLERARLRERQEAFSKHIPKVLFVKNGKLDEKAWTAEVEKRVKNPKWEVQDVIDFYETKMLNSELAEVPSLVRRASSPYYNPLGQLHSASSLETDEEKVKAEKCLRLNGGF